MNNDFIEKYKNDEKVKSILDELKATEKEYAEKEREAKKQQQAEHKQWYNSLSDEEKFNEQIRLTKEKLKKLNAQKREHDRKKAKSESQKERDARTHYLIQLGAELDSALHNYYPDYVTGDPNALEILKNFLYAKGSTGHPFFPRYWDNTVNEMNQKKSDPVQETSDESDVVAEINLY